MTITPIATVDGRYALVYADSKNSNTTHKNPLLLQGGIYAIFLEYGKVAIREPAVLYQTSITGLLFVGIDCSIEHLRVGQTCIVTFTNQTATDYFYLKIDFLSSGTVYNVDVESLNAQLKPVTGQHDQNNVESLRYGGYFFSGQGENKDDPKTILMYGYITNGNVTYSWDLQNPIVTNRIGIYTILNNNTFVCALPEETQNWSLITTELFKFEEERGKVTRSKKKII